MKVRYFIAPLLFSLIALPLDVQAQKPLDKPVVSAQVKALLSKRDYKRAAAELSKAIALHPRDVGLYVSRSFAYGAGGEYNKAQEDRRRFTRLDDGNREVNLKRSLQEFQALTKREPKNAHVLLNIGDILSSLGRYSEARQSYDRALALSPDLAPVLVGRGFALVQLKDYDKALTDFNRSLTLQPSVDAHNGLALVYAMQVKVEPALLESSKALALNPKRPASYSLRGSLYTQRGQYDKAIAEYDRALSLDPLDVRTYLERASAHDALRHRESAWEDVDLALRLAPNNWQVRLMRASMSGDREDYAGAVDEYSRSIALNPKNGTAYYLRGTVYQTLAAKDPAAADKALADFNHAVALDPKDTEALSYRAFYYFGRNQLQLALADLNKLIGLAPQNVDAYALRAMTYDKLGESEKSVADYRKALELAPSNAGASHRIAVHEATQSIAATPNEAEHYIKRATAYSQLGEVDAAIADYNQAIKLDPKNAAYYNLRGVAYSNKRAMAEASADFNKAIAVEPGFVKAYENRIAMGASSEQALADTTKILEAEPKNIGALVKRGGLHHSQGDDAAALADYNRILTLDPKHTETYVARAELYAGQGERVKAINDYNAALRLDSKRADLLNARGLLYLRQGDTDQARADFSAAAKTDSGPLSRAKENLELVSLAQRIKAKPGDASNYLNRVRFVMTTPRSDSLGFYNKAEAESVLADLAKVIALSPRDAEPYALRAQITSRSTSAVFNLSKTIADCTTALRLDPKRADVLNLRGNCFLRRGGYAAAVADYLAATKLDPGYAPGLYGRNLFTEEEAQQKGVAFFTDAIKRSPRSSGAYLNRAVLYADMEDWPKAIADYGNVLRLEPKRALAHYLRGIAFQRNSEGEWDRRNVSSKAEEAKSAANRAKALADYDAAIRLDPKLASAYFQRGEVRGGKDATRALADYGTFIQLNPRFAGYAHYQRAEAFYAKKQWAKALADYNAYLRLPNPISTQYLTYIHSIARSRSADAYVALGNAPKAIAIYTELLKTPPGGALHGVYRDRGHAYFLKGDTTKAISDYDAALNYLPAYTEVYKLRAQAYRKLGQVERAGADEAVAAVLTKKSA